ncbi:serine hydrolase domain-containing protein [Nakamurella endophytica]|uniref:Serine hydrolase n=1 Tax=Nakamurella endophytica TaxID=1748367 RepID=A0A917SSH0_9ACTN|nr:serine hydrolase domain-containing protein [Nakamurella endophytica]GGL96435.1 serine hydrolase [Nakamurella endophytica]
MTQAPHPLPDDESLAEALDYAGRYLEFQQRYQRVPGVQVAVFARGGVRLSAAFGLADTASGTALTTGHLFRIASHSKTFTATTVLQLVEQGRLRLDDRAAAWIPELDGHPAGDWTVRELLNHAAGAVRDGTDGDFWQLRLPFPDRSGLLDVLRSAGAAVLERNERFKYSNIGFGLLGMVVEAASGRTFADHVRDDIAGRLGLADLGAELDPDRAGEYATGYSALSYADHRVAIDHVDTRALAAATGCWATAEALVQYFAAHFHGDERLLTDGSKRLLHRGWWPVDGEKDARYGLGFSLRAIGDRSLPGHGGGYPGHITNSVFDPEAGFAVSVLTNAIDGPAQALATAVVQLMDLAGREPRPAPDGRLDGFTGRYASLWGVVDIAVLGGRLYLLPPSAADPTDHAAPLDVVDDRRLRIAGGSGFGSYGEELVFDVDAAGSVRSVRAESGMTRWPIDAFPLLDGDRVTVPTQQGAG